MPEKQVLSNNQPDVIVINGASSSGKTSIAKRLQEKLSNLYLNLSIDSVLYGLPPTDLQRMIDGSRILRKDYEYDKLVVGYHAAAVGLLSTGNRLILDNAITREMWRLDLEERLREFCVLRVGVTCEPSILKRREHARGDRAMGTAEREAKVVHSGWSYDIVVDTTARASEACARDILALVSKSCTNLSCANFDAESNP